ncbi:MAG: hypothetical protein ACM4AI_05155 [Acidobacteriota bacterium]
MKNRVEMVGYAAILVAGLCITTSLLSLAVSGGASSVTTPVTVGVFGLSLLSLGMLAVWHGLRPPAQAVAPLLYKRETPARPREVA